MTSTSKSEINDDTFQSMRCLIGPQIGPEWSFWRILDQSLLMRFPLLLLADITTDHD